MKRFIRTFTRFGVAAASLTLVTAARLAAQGTITGTIMGGDPPAPLADARVVIVNTLLTATTDQTGKYTLRNVPAGAASVMAMHVGYQSQRKAVNISGSGNATVDFAMPVSVVQLNEIVTTATGDQRRSEIGNSIVSLGNIGSTVEQIKVSTASDLFLAKAPGVSVLPATLLGGAPSVRIRGTGSISLNNQPIFVVDGVRYNSGTTQGSSTSFSLLNSLDPEQIEDIEIVKGPSAATLYGTQAANGVVVITTKKGRAGPARWNWFVEGGSVQDRNNYPSMYMNWGHAPGTTAPIRCQLALMNTAATDGGTPCISDSLTHYLLLRDPSRTFIHDGQETKYGVSIVGGNDALRYFISSDMSDEWGPIQMPGFEQARFAANNIPLRGEWIHPLAQQQVNFRTNLNATMSPKLDVGVSMGFNKSNNRIMPTDAQLEAIYYVGLQNYGFVGPGPGKITTTAEGAPLNEYYQYAPGDVLQESNKQDLQRFTGSVNANWRPFSWLQNDATLGLDLADYDYYRICRLNECALGSSLRIGSVNDNRSTNRNYTTKVASTASFDPRTWLNLKTTVGIDYNNSEGDGVNSSGSTLPPGGNNVGAASTRNASNTQPTVVKTLGYFIQEQAGFRDKLFITAAVRSDQNSAFGTNFQKVYYPKFSASWLLSDESFFRSPKWLQSLRLRSAYGASGVQPGATAALITYSASAVNLPLRVPTATTGTNTPALVASQPGLPDLRPETSKEYEAGFDATLFDGRAHFEYTFYNRQSYDALISVPLAPSTAASQLSVLQNVGSIKNSGHEASLTVQLMDRANFGWDVTLNGSHNTNVVVNLGLDPATNARRIIGAGGTTQQREGLPINGQWYRSYTFNDANHDGILEWNKNDALSEVHVDTALKFLGVTSPRDIFSIQQGFDLFKRTLRINMSFDYKGGFNVQDGANNFQCNTDPRACAETQDPKSPLNEQARNIAKTYGSNWVINGTTTNFKTSGGYFMSGQYWRWRELSLAYTLPQPATRALMAQKGSTVVLGFRNLHHWTSFTDVDPEVNNGLSQNDNQSNFQSAPPPTYVSLRLNLKY